MTDVSNWRVRLGLLDPDPGKGTRLRAWDWPTVEGRLIAELPGLHGLTWHLVELGRSLPRGFNPFGLLPERIHSRPVRYLLVWPAPAIPTAEVPERFIAESLMRRETVLVGVSIGAPPDELPMAINMDAVREFPYLCGGELEALEPR
jgi:hypothetical protein